MTVVTAESAASLGSLQSPRRLPWRLPRLSTTAMTCFGVATHFLIHGNRTDIEIPVSPQGLLFPTILPSIIPSLSLLLSLWTLNFPPGSGYCGFALVTVLHSRDDRHNSFTTSSLCTRTRCFPTRFLVFIQKVCCLLSPGVETCPLLSA